MTKDQDWLWKMENEESTFGPLNFFLYIFLQSPIVTPAVGKSRNKTLGDVV